MLIAIAFHFTEILPLSILAWLFLEVHELCLYIPFPGMSSASLYIGNLTARGYWKCYPAENTLYLCSWLVLHGFLLIGAQVQLEFFLYVGEFPLGVVWFPELSILVAFGLDMTLFLLLFEQGVHFSALQDHPWLLQVPPWSYFCDHLRMNGSLSHFVPVFGRFLLVFLCYIEHGPLLPLL